MPAESATIDAPAGSSQSPTGAPTGIADFAAEMAATVAKATAAPAEAKPDKPAGAVKEAAPAEPVKESKVETPEKEPAAKPDKPSWSSKKLEEMTGEEITELMKNGPSKAFKVHEFSKGKYEAKIAEYEGKIKAIEAKPVESPGDARKIEAYEKQIKELNEQTSTHLKTIAELDYSRSPEFKRQFTDRLAGAYQTAVDEIKQLTVTLPDETTRPATQQDFDLLMSLPAGEQAHRARQMFGDAVDTFFANRNEIRGIQRQGREALKQAQEEAESRRTQTEVQTKESQRVYEAQVEVEFKDLAEKLPELFGDTDNKDAEAAKQKGLDYARGVLTDRDKMTPQERAAHDVILQATHAAFRRMVVESKARDAQIEALEAELKKFRKSDPGATDGSGKPPLPVDADDVPGIDGMSAKFLPAQR